MIADLQDASSDPFQDKVFDVCICGAGVAGITLALRLSRNLNVLLLEAGGAEYSEQSQAVYEGSIVGRDYFDLTGTRLRYFGGTSNRWAGWCRPLDPIDFKPKPYAGISGWPIDERDPTPYLDEAKAILDIQSAPDRPEGHSDKHVSKQIPSSGDFESIEFLWSLPPTRFGTKFRPELEAAQNVVCFLNANCRYPLGGQQIDRQSHRSSHLCGQGLSSDFPLSGPGSRGHRESKVVAERQ
jgi:hypothetical protein